MHNGQITRPQGTVLIWNYRDRLTTKSDSGAALLSGVGSVPGIPSPPSGGESTDFKSSESPHEIEQLIINSASLLSISTMKSKSSPAGTFTIKLAPTFNWVTRITTGSWLSIMMTKDVIIPQIKKSNGRIRANIKADPKWTKMLGRIDSVRLEHTVDQVTGVRKKVYTVVGRDWGSVFESKLYIDTLILSTGLEKEGPVGVAGRLTQQNMLGTWLDKDANALPSAKDVVEGLLRLWGAPVKELTNSVSMDLPGQLIAASKVYELPKEVAVHFKFTDVTGAPSKGFGEIIKIKDGALVDKDVYTSDSGSGFGPFKGGLGGGGNNGDINDASGFISLKDLHGEHTFWQLLNDNCNPTVMEMVTDLRFEGDNPVLALYRRVRPFIINENFEGKDKPVVSNLVSLFKNVRTTTIALDDVLQINAGTNARDRLNFIEVLPSAEFLGNPLYAAQNKLDAQIFDSASFQRDGFLGRVYRPSQLPVSDNGVTPSEATDWKYLLKEWFFNTHVMLNGSVTFVGQNQFIGVGDNIRIDAKVLGDTLNMNSEHRPGQFLLCHVESVRHDFKVNQEDGTRNFFTTIQFVRGVIADKNNKTILPLNSALDANALTMDGIPEKAHNVSATSTAHDTDVEKARGGLIIER